MINTSAADMSKLAMIEIANDRRLQELGYKLLIPVHDEVIGECPKENAKVCSERVAQIMEEVAMDKMDIPMKVDIACSKEWYGEKIKL